MPPRSAALLTILVVLLAVFLRFQGLGVHDAWADEGISWAIAQSPAPMETALRDANGEPPLFQLAISLLARLSDRLEVLRSASALFGSLAVVLCAWGLRRFATPWTAAWGTALFGLSAFEIYYAQELRAYALLSLLGLALLFMHIELHRRERLPFGFWAGLCVLTTAIVYAHYLAVAYMLGFTLAVAIAPTLRRHWKPWLVSQAAAALLFLPWLGVALSGIRVAGQVRFITDFQPVRDFIAPFVLLLAGRSVTPGGVGRLAWIALAGMGGVSALWCLGGWLSLRRRGQGPLAALLISTGVASVAIVVLECVLWISNYNFLHVKYVIWAHGPLVLLAASWFEGEAQAGRRWAALLTLHVFLLVNGWSMWNYRFSDEYLKAPAYRQMASWMESRVESGDAILYDWLGTCQAMDPACARLRGFAGVTRGILVDLGTEGPTARMAPTGLQARLAPAGPCGARRVWIVLFKDWRSRRERGFEDARLRLRRRIEALTQSDRYVLEEGHEARGLEVFCLVRR